MSPISILSSINNKSTHTPNNKKKIDENYAIDNGDDTDAQHEQADKTSMFKTVTEMIKTYQTALILELTRRLPVLVRLKKRYNDIPPAFKYACFFLWVAWKILFTIFIVYVIGGRPHSNTQSDAQVAMGQVSDNNKQADLPLTRVLYIITSLSEYNNGRRSTVKGQDRLAEVMVPVLIDSLESMTFVPFADVRFQVDVVLILAYELRPEREEYIRQQLPPGVGLEIWDDACPLGYDHSTEKVSDNTRALARQHRYVIKDKFDYYDVFLAFEDDMRITGQHVHNYLKQSRKLDVLRKAAPESVSNVPENMDPLHQKYFGPWTRQQMDRLVPGFVRVEVLQNETAYGAQTELDPIPLDYMFEDYTNPSAPPRECHFDATICCHVQMHPNVDTPIHPTKDKVIIWETAIKALSARQLPALPDSGNDGEWAILLPGPGKRLTDSELIGGYWSGREGAFGKDVVKPSPGMPDLIAQQGGWMATREQLYRMDGGLCQGRFLPPFDKPIYRKDGQESMNVEFWSGGYQFFTGVLGGCNMQRVLTMNPDDYSKQFIYHVANNKQRQLSRSRMLRADHLMAQLNTVVKMAQRAKQKVLQGK
jgi:hypothetical protein